MIKIKYTKHTSKDTRRWHTCRGHTIRRERRHTGWHHRWRKPRCTRRSRRKGRSCCYVRNFLLRQRLFLLIRTKEGLTSSKIWRRWSISHRRGHSKCRRRGTQMLRAESETACRRTPTFIGGRDLVDDALGFVVSKCYSKEQNQTWS